jgi:hypothetical protein
MIGEETKGGENKLSKNKEREREMEGGGGGGEGERVAGSLELEWRTIGKEANGGKSKARCFALWPKGSASAKGLWHARLRTHRQALAFATALLFCVLLCLCRCRGAVEGTVLVAVIARDGGPVTRKYRLL